MGTLVSIIIPVYNVEPYIRQCLESVMAQTMSEGIECIIVDDCGQDNSIHIAEEMIASYHGPIQFSIIHHEHNKGLSAARNTGIHAAKGEWLYFLDSDDWIIPECIQLMMECVDKHPNSELIQGGTFSNDKGFCNWLGIENKYNIPSYTEDKTWINEHTLFQEPIFVTAWNKLVLRDFLLKNKLFFEEGMINEDECWSFMLSKYLSKVSFVHKNTYYYNIRENSIISNRDKTINNYPNILKFKIKNIGGKYRSREVATTARFLLLYQMYNKTYTERRIYRTLKIQLWWESCLGQKIVLFKYLFLHGSNEVKNRLFDQLWKNKGNII